LKKLIIICALALAGCERTVVVPCGCNSATKPAVDTIFVPVPVERESEEKGSSYL